MRYRIEVVKKDDNGREFSRSMVGEYNSEIDALKALETQEKVLRTMGSNDTCVEMVRLGQA